MLSKVQMEMEIGLGEREEEMGVSLCTVTHTAGSVILIDEASTRGTQGFWAMCLLAFRVDTTHCGRPFGQRSQIPSTRRLVTSPPRARSLTISVSPRSSGLVSLGVAEGKVPPGSSSLFG